MSRFSKKQIIWGGVVLVIILIGGFFFTKKAPLDTQNQITVKRGDVVQEVNVTGRVKAANIVNFGFEKSARIQGVYTKVGDRVRQGALLAEVESSLAQAGLLEAQARLAELKRGSRPEELAVKEAELAKYEQDLANEYSGVLDGINDGLNQADDALHSKIAGIFSGSKASSYKFTFQVCDTQADVNATWLRYTTELDIDVWRVERETLSITPTQEKLIVGLNNTVQHLEKTREFLESVNRVLTLGCAVVNTSLDTYRTNVNTARGNIVAVISEINTKKQTIASLALTVTKIKNELALLRAGQAGEVIAAQEARVLSAEGELRKHKIYAPINGTVTKVDATPGEFASVATPLFGIISLSAFEMEANVPEADIAKIKVGNIAQITLDAYGPDVLFLGSVVGIDPAETIIDNVPTYKVTFHFSKEDSRIKSGMTANIDIATDSRKNVLVIPARALITKDNNKFVTVINNNEGSTIETPVTIGLRGSDGSVEIVSGLTENTLILITLKK